MLESLGLLRKYWVTFSGDEASVDIDCEWYGSLLQ
jgi:hypothetical protein